VKQYIAKMLFKIFLSLYKMWRKPNMGFKALFRRLKSTEIKINGKILIYQSEKNLNCKTSFSLFIEKQSVRLLKQVWRLVLQK